jgi:hypothetical protein
MGFLFLRQLAVTEFWCGSSVSLLWAVLVQVSAPAPQSGWRLFAISPDMAELLAVLALGENILGSISLHSDSNVAEAWQKENFVGLCRRLEVYEEQGQVYEFELFRR